MAKVYLLLEWDDPGNEGVWVLGVYSTREKAEAQRLVEIARMVTDDVERYGEQGRQWHINRPTERYGITIREWEVDGPTPSDYQAVKDAAEILSFMPRPSS